jgi:hypothetical protein
MDKAISYSYAAKLYSEASDLGVSFMPQSFVDMSYSIEKRKTAVLGDVINSGYGASYDSLRAIFGDKFAGVGCRNIKTYSCGSEPNSAVNILKDGGGVLLGSQQITIKKDFPKMVSEDSSGTPFCYAKYIYTFSSSDLLSNVDLTCGNKDWFNLNSQEKAPLRNLFVFNSNDCATNPTTCNKWLDTFWTTFNPFELGLPKGIGIWDTLKVLIDKGLMAFVGNIAQIILYYIAKITFWILVYALAIHLWRKAAMSGGLSIYWILIFAIIILILFGFITSYSQFVGYFRFGT